MQSLEKEHWENLRTLIGDGVPEQIESYLTELEPGELVRALFRLSADEQRTLLTTISPDSAVEVLDELPDVHAAELLDELSSAEAASIAGELASDDLADLLGEMDSDDAEAILEQMDDEAAADARELMEYPADSAGGLMQTELIAYPRATLAAAVLADLAAREGDYALYGAQFIYVVVKRRKLVGVLRLRDLIACDPNARVGDLARPAFTVTPDASLDDLEDFFDEHEFNVAPVVDAAGMLRGVVRRRVVNEALTERGEMDRMRQAGIVSGEELRSMSVSLRSRRRLSWLSINIVLNLIAASVIALYQDTLSAVIALAVFLPIVSDMSGCSGNQAVAVSLRELTLGVVVPRDLMRVWAKEAAVGVINGIALGLLIALAAYLWQGNPWLGAVIGGALALNTVVAVSIGGTVPLALKGLGIDPALASGPILTTITDMCGFFLVLSMATLTLPLLT